MFVYMLLCMHSILLYIILSFVMTGEDLEFLSE